MNGNINKNKNKCKGEQMPAEFDKFPHDMAECDCLIVMGTSLQVHPFSSLVDYVRDECPRLLVNRDLVGDWRAYADDEAAESSHNYRDVCFIGTCDDGSVRLAELLGWKTDLDKLIDQNQSAPLPQPTNAAKI